MTCTGSHTVTQAEMDAPSGTLVNTVTVKSSAPDATDTHTIPVAKDPKLTVDKTSTTTTVTAAGQVVPYSYVVKNTGNVTLTDITVTDDKVATITCPLTTLTPNQSTTCTGNHTVTQAEIDAGGNLVNIAVAHSGPTDSPPDSVTIPIASTRVLSLVKSADQTSVTGGNTIVYTLVYKNTGNATARDVKITETVPAGTDYDSCTGGCVQNGSTVTWTIPSVPPGGATASVTFTVKVKANIDACSICNTATIASPDQNAGVPINSNQLCIIASPSADPSTAKALGDAVGLKAVVGLLGIPLLNAEISKASSSQTGPGQTTDDDKFLSLDILGVIGLASVAKADVLTTTSDSSVSKLQGARQTSTSEVLGLNILNGLVTADVVRSVASTTATGHSSSYSAAGIDRGEPQGPQHRPAERRAGDEDQPAHAAVRLRARTSRSTSRPARRAVRRAVSSSAARTRRTSRSRRSS